MKELHWDDLALMRRVQNGDLRAMDALVDKYRDAVYRFAYRLVRDHEQASDIVAEAFVRAYQGAKSFKGEARFTTWMYRIVTNAFLDARKRAASRATVSLDDQSRFGPEGTVLSLADRKPSPQLRAEGSERSQKLSEAINRLPEYQKAMIIMYHVEGLSYEEMADTLSLPIGTVKSRLNRARNSLRDMLQGEKMLFLAA